MSRCGAAVMPRCLPSARARRKLPRNMGREKMRRLTALLLAAGPDERACALDARGHLGEVEAGRQLAGSPDDGDRPRVRKRRSEEHTSELQSLMRISYAVFCLK